MKDRNSTIGFILLAILMLAYFWFDGKKRAAHAEEQRIKDSIELVQIEANQVLEDSTKVTSDTTSQTDKSMRINVDSLDMVRLAVRYGAFAMSAEGDVQDYVIENEFAKFTFTNQGGRLKQVELKEFKKSVYNEEKENIVSPLLLLEDERNKFGYNLPVREASAVVSTEDLVFKATQDGNRSISFKAFAGSPDKYFEQVYTIKEDYTLDYTINMNGLGDVFEDGTDEITLDWLNYLDRIEKSTDYESSLSTAYYKASEKSPSYCSCRGDDKVNKEKPMDWVAHANQFFNTSLIAKNQPFNSMVSEIELIDVADGDLKKVSTQLKVPFANTFSMNIYSGPNEFRRLSSFDNDLEYIIPYGSSLLGTINRYVIRPLFNFFSGFIGNKGIVILIVTFLVKMILFPLTYKMLYSQSKMAALKGQIDAIKKRIGDDQQAVQMETMKLYRETGVNPLGGCLPMVIQMPIWIALYRFFPASIEFRQASFLWANDLASYDVFTWLPFPIPFYGEHLSLFTLLWAITTVIYTFYNTRHMDMSANPAMKYVQYFMPLMFLFFFNTMAAGLTCYMFFSNLINITQTVVTKGLIINKDKVAKELEDYKKKPKKEGGFRDRLAKAFEEAQKAQEERQRAEKSGKKKKK